MSVQTQIRHDQSREGARHGRDGEDEDSKTGGGRKDFGAAAAD